MVFGSRMLLTVALLSLYALTANAASQHHVQSPSCSCSSGFIPVPVDVIIPVDPSNPDSTTMQLRTTFDVYGSLCEPVPAALNTNSAVQLLLHGHTYNAQYWDVTWGGFQNYSFVAHSCRRGISSFAYDNLGAGRTIRQNSTHVQVPSAANVSSSLARDLKSGRVSTILTGQSKHYQKVIGIGHSLGSVTLNYAVIGDGAYSPFDGLVLTGDIHDSTFRHIATANINLPASVINPGRWSNLDPGYITTPNISARSIFYGPDNGTSFSMTILQLDELTKDAGSKWMSFGIPSVYTAAFGFRGPVIEVIGSLDQIHCLTGSNPAPCNQAELQLSEAMYFPDSSNFTTIVLDGYGHDLNYQYAAVELFPLMSQLFESFIT